MSSLTPNSKTYIKGISLIFAGSLIGFIGMMYGLFANSYFPPLNFELMVFGYTMAFLGVTIAVAGSFYTAYAWFKFMQRMDTSLPPPDDEYRTCPRCSASYRPASGYCMKCGLEFIRNQDIGSTVPSVKTSLRIQPLNGFRQPDSLKEEHPCEVCGQPTSHNVMGQWLCKDHLGAVW